MKTIHKYLIDFTEVREKGKIEIETSNPFGKPVLIEMQGDMAYLWLEEPQAEKKQYMREFYVVGTGHEIPEGKLWMGSWQQGRFVWHLFS